MRDLLNNPRKEREVRESGRWSTGWLKWHARKRVVRQEGGG